MTAEKAMPKTSAMPQHPALTLLPRGLFLMTSAFDSKRAGVLVDSVQACGENPPLLCVAMRKGHWIEPIIRDSRSFAICLIDPSDRLMRRKFVEPGMAREPGDPFDCMPLDRLSTGAPIVRRSIAAIDCEVSRHLDIDAEHALYVGIVLASRVYQTPASGDSDSPLTMHAMTPSPARTG